MRVFNIYFAQGLLVECRTKMGFDGFWELHLLNLICFISSQHPELYSHWEIKRTETVVIWINFIDGCAFGCQWVNNSTPWWRLWPKALGRSVFQHDAPVPYTLWGAEEGATWDRPTYSFYWEGHPGCRWVSRSVKKSIFLSYMAFISIIIFKFNIYYPHHYELQAVWRSGWLR